MEMQMLKKLTVLTFSLQLNNTLVYTNQASMFYKCFWYTLRTQLGLKYRIRQMRVVKRASNVGQEEGAKGVIAVKKNNAKCSVSFQTSVFKIVERNK